MTFPAQVGSSFIKAYSVVSASLYATNPVPSSSGRTSKKWLSVSVKPSRRVSTFPYPFFSIRSHSWPTRLGLRRIRRTSALVEHHLRALRPEAARRTNLLSFRSRLGFLVAQLPPSQPLHIERQLCLPDYLVLSRNRELLPAGDRHQRSLSRSLSTGRRFHVAHPIVAEELLPLEQCDRPAFVVVDQRFDRRTFQSCLCSLRTETTAGVPVECHGSRRIDDQSGRQATATQGDRHVEDLRSRRRNARRLAAEKRFVDCRTSARSRKIVQNRMRKSSSLVTAIAASSFAFVQVEYTKHVLQVKDRLQNPLSPSEDSSPEKIKSPVVAPRPSKPMDARQEALVRRCASMMLPPPPILSKLNVPEIEVQPCLHAHAPDCLSA